MRALDDIGDDRIGHGCARAGTRTTGIADLDPVSSTGEANIPCGKVRLSSSGAHWFDRSTGLNILLDEVDVPSASWSRAPRYASIALTNACELRCPFCYAPKVPARLESGAVLSWAVELDEEGALGIGFGGGEPTAHAEFALICSEVARRTKMAVTFTTHGHRMTSGLANALRGSVHFIRVSMDGYGATYERFRGRSFSEFARRVEIIATVAPFGLNVVVNDETVQDLDPIDAFAAEVGASEVLLLPEQPVGARPGISTRACERLTAWVLSRRAPVRLAISEATVPDGVPLAQPFAGETPLDAHVHLDAQGILRPHAYAREGVPIATSVIGALDQLRSAIGK